jgi:hypothetical protein
VDSSGRRQGRARWRGPALSVSKRPGSRALFRLYVLGMARPSQRQGCAMPKTDRRALLIGLGAPLKSGVCLRQTAGEYFRACACVRRSGAFGRRVFAAQCFWLASPVSSGPGPTDPGYANKGAWLPLGRRLGWPAGSGIQKVLGYPESELLAISEIHENLQNAHLRPIGLQASAALACKRPLCNASRRCNLGTCTRSPENPASPRLQNTPRWIEAPRPIEIARRSVLAWHQPCLKLGRCQARTG